MIKKSIVRRWVFSVLLGIIIPIIIIGVCLSLAIKSQYYDSVRMTLNSRASSMMVSDFNTPSAANDEQFVKAARKFIDRFSDKNIMEVWVIDRNGNVVISSSGFSVKGEVYPDYDYAKTDESGKGEWTGRMQNGEKVMALTYMLPQNDNGVNGAVRYIISLDEIDRQLIVIWCFIGLLMLVFILSVISSGAFFMRSIISPVKKINETAAKIAKGDFSAAIEPYKYNDEIGQLCETINYMAKEIDETERMKNEFISTVSHELRTPLTAIKGWGETIRSVKDTDSEIVDKGISVIVNESERLTQLVEELLDFSRMESGKMTLKTETVDIVRELDDVLQVFQERSERERINLLTGLPENSVLINADGNRLKQAFVNIIDNSFKYNSPGGFVKVTLEDKGNAVMVVIEDNGCGISKTDLSRVCEKFYKANNSVRGSGIGLAVTDEIIKLHGGEMLIDSKLGKGTVTTLILPYKK